MLLDSYRGSPAVALRRVWPCTLDAIATNLILPQQERESDTPSM